jgi:hypothetical protein
MHGRGRRDVVGGQQLVRVLLLVLVGPEDEKDR